MWWKFLTDYRLLNNRFIDFRLPATGGSVKTMVFVVEGLTDNRLLNNRFIGFRLSASRLEKIMVFVAGMDAPALMNGCLTQLSDSVKMKTNVKITAM